ncbi:DUF4407 domain-containing protein [Actinomadura rubrisoli]|uniref:DUF4407 domain-containing protein n=1 Tax=Actinomadura rubrisoli TaxID=2530368 RepID=A0A4R5CHN7_9ACTN|nr:DUF4407 domain-containing protein [Actinomadura rubrisoli]TDD96844.1 DUF4407 domain-containing protein [Actinomadura rubrisoli]
MKNVLVWLSSAREEALELSPGDKPKYVGVGSAILITGSIAGVAMAFALQSAVQVAAPLAVAFGLAWALGITMLDRWLVSSIHRGSRWQNLLTAVPRLALAVLFGVVISTPIVLRIFGPEIGAEITRIHQTDADEFQKGQKEGPLGKAIADQTAQRDGLNKIVSTGGDAPRNPAEDPVIMGLQSSLKQAQADSEAAYKKLQCQLYGPCKPKGRGPLSDAAQKAYDASQKQVSAITGQIEDRKRRLSANDDQSRARRVADAKAALPGVQSRLDEQVARQDALQKSFTAKQRTSNGLLMKIRALDQLSDQDPSMRTAHRALILVFTVIEILPVLVKLLMLFAPKSAYDKVLEMQESEDLVRAELVIRTSSGAKEVKVDDAIRELWGIPAEPEGNGAPPGAAGLQPPGGDPGPEWSADHPDEHGSPHRWDAEQLLNMPDTHVYGHGDGDPDFDEVSPDAGFGGESGGFRVPRSAGAGFTSSERTGKSASETIGPRTKPWSSAEDGTDRLLEFDD